MTGAPAIQAFFDEPTNTVSYLVSDPVTRRAAVIDPVLDYDHRTGKASVKSAGAILEAAAVASLAALMAGAPELEHSDISCCIPPQPILTL